MTAVYREQWIFWAATNVFSIYLWWGESLQIQGKYLIYLINSLVGGISGARQQKALKKVKKGSDDPFFVLEQNE